MIDGLTEVNYADDLPIDHHVFSGANFAEKFVL